LPLEQSLVDKYPGGNWIYHLNEGGCSGPFMVKSYKQGVELDMVPNPRWEQAWGKHLTITEVDRPFIASQDSEYHTYDTSSTYDFTDVPPDEYTFAVGQSDFHQIASLLIDYFGVNFHQPPFDNLDVRQAFDLALNKQLLVDRVFNGEAIPTNHIVPQGMPGFNSRLTAPDGTQSITGDQPTATRDLIAAKSKCTPGVLVPDYCPFIDGKTAQDNQVIYLSAGVGADASQKEIATIATQTWSQVLGLNVQIKPFSDLNGLEGQIFAPTGNTAQLWQIGWVADYPDPQDWLSLQFRTGALYNIENVSNTAMDKLMDEADTNQSPAQRMSEYNQVEQYMVTQVSWIPFDQEKTSWRVRPWVQGFGLNAELIMEDVDWPNVYIEAH
jgi:peptide/nickel transport system substrate-binding protein/oligopeptide transport system substrate-binding protein